MHSKIQNLEGIVVPPSSYFLTKQKNITVITVITDRQ